MIGKLWTAFGARVIGLAVSGAVGWIYTRTRGAVQLDAGVLSEMITVQVGTYAASHRYASSKINPADAASKPLADAGNNTNAVLKADRDRVSGI